MELESSAKMMLPYSDVELDTGRGLFSFAGRITPDAFTDQAFMSLSPF